MKIKKTFQGTVPENKILNSDSSSETDTYSCKYINEEFMKKDEGEVYSTEEVRIGTWIDGKPLYRKVVSLGNLPNSTTKDIQLGVIYSQYNFVNIKGYAKGEWGTTPLPFMNADEYTALYVVGSGVSSSTATAIIRINTNKDKSAYTGHAILEYTKTTD